MVRPVNFLSVLFLCLALVGVLPAAVHAEPRFEVVAYDLTLDEYGDLVEFVHGMLESTPPDSSLWEQLKLKLNPFHFARTSRRIGNLISDTNSIRVNGALDPREEFKNILFLFAASHGSETLSGGVFYLAGSAMGLDPKILYPVTGALTSMIIPGGVDWVCYATQITYMGSQDFRDVVQGVRVFTVRTVQGTGHYTGVNEFLNALIEARHPAAHFQTGLQTATTHTALAKRGVPEFLMQDPAVAHRFTFYGTDRDVAKGRAGTPIVTVNLKPANERALYLESVEVHPEILRRGYRGDANDFAYQVVREHLQELLRAFTGDRGINRLFNPIGSDVGQAVVETLDQVVRGNLNKHLYSPFVLGAELFNEAGLPINRQVTGPLFEHEHDEPQCHGHDHDHDHAHCKRALQETVVTNEDITIAPGGVKVWYRGHSVQLKPVWYWHPREAFAAIPSIACNRLQEAGNLACASFMATGHGMVWLAQHPQYIVYGPVLGVGKTVHFGAKASIKTVRIGLQLVKSLASAGIWLTHRFDSILNWVTNDSVPFVSNCASWVVDYFGRSRPGNGPQN